jgi:hypothetical protein
MKKKKQICNENSVFFDMKVRASDIISEMIKFRKLIFKIGFL